MQHVVKFGMIAGAGNVIIFNKICSWRARKVPLAAPRVQFRAFRVGSWSDRSRIMVGSVSDHGRIGRALEMTFSAVFGKFLSDLGWSFCVASAVFGEVGGC